MGPEMGHVQLSKREGRAGGACFFSSRRRHTRYWRDWSQTCALPISVRPGPDEVWQNPDKPRPTYVLDAYEGGLPSASYLGMLADAAEAAGRRRPPRPRGRSLRRRKRRSEERRVGKECRSRWSPYH